MADVRAPMLPSPAPRRTMRWAPIGDGELMWDGLPRRAMAVILRRRPFVEPDNSAHGGRSIPSWLNQISAQRDRVGVAVARERFRPHDR